MPGQVIVVKRSRRSLFAVPRASLDWLRSVWAVFFRTSAPDTEVVRKGSTSLLPTGAPLFPQLVRDENGSHRCVGCDLCVRVCPSRCLVLETEGEGAARRVLRFDLIGAACVGCEICSEACPEEAIEMAAAARVELAGISGRPVATDLLATRG
jgi:ferredoxin